MAMRGRIASRMGMRIWMKLNRNGLQNYPFAMAKLRTCDFYVFVELFSCLMTETHSGRIIANSNWIDNVRTCCWSSIDKLYDLRISSYILIITFDGWLAVAYQGKNGRVKFTSIYKFTCEFLSHPSLHFLSTEAHQHIYEDWMNFYKKSNTKIPNFRLFNPLSDFNGASVSDRGPIWDRKNRNIWLYIGKIRIHYYII